MVFGKWIAKTENQNKKDDGGQNHKNFKVFGRGSVLVTSNAVTFSIDFPLWVSPNAWILNDQYDCLYL